MKNIQQIENILNEIKNIPGNELEDYFVYLTMELASDKLNGRIKQETIDKIEEFKEKYCEMVKGNE